MLVDYFVFSQTVIRISHSQQHQAMLTLRALNWNCQKCVRYLQKRRGQGSKGVMQVQGGGGGDAIVGGWGWVSSNQSRDSGVLNLKSSTGAASAQPAQATSCVTFHQKVRANFQTGQKEDSHTNQLVTFEHQISADFTSITKRMQSKYTSP